MNGHAIFFHSHTEMENQDHYTHQHDHDHYHSAHQHQQGIAALWDWITEALGDFEHSDQGDKHLEIYQVSNLLSKLNHISTVDIDFLPIHWQVIDLSKYTSVQNSGIPLFEQSFSDPPFLDAPSNRGPPLFS